MRESAEILDTLNNREMWITNESTLDVGRNYQLVMKEWTELRNVEAVNDWW